MPKWLLASAHTALERGSQNLTLLFSEALAETAGKPSDARKTSSILSFMSQSPESSCLEVCLLQKKNYKLAGDNNGLNIFFCE